MERYTPLRALCSRIADEIVCVRVTRLWYHRGGTDGGPVKDIHMVVVDMQGDAFHVIVPHGFSPNFIHVLHEKNVYELSKFRLVKRQEVMRPVDMPFAIVVTHSTIIKRRDDLVDVLPEWSYSLTPISCLLAPTVETGCLVDVIGTICSISDIESFDLTTRGTVLIKRHVFLKDLCGHEIKIVLWGPCALRFNGNTIRTLGQTESAVAIFVGATTQEYDGERGLAGMSACAWYINEDIPDINIFRASLAGTVQPIAHAPLPHLLTRRTQVGDDWPKKQIVQLTGFNLFENKSARFRSTVTLSRIVSRKHWWYTACEVCRRLSRPDASTHADSHGYGCTETYACSDPHCRSTAATLVYHLSVIASDKTDEAEFILLGALAERVIGTNIHRLIRNNQPAGPPAANARIAASRVRFPPSEVSRRLGDRYRFVVEVTEGSFSRPRTSFMVREIEAFFPRERRLSSLDTLIPSTSWDVGNPKVVPSPSGDMSSTVEPGPSNHVSVIPNEPATVILPNIQGMDAPGSRAAVPVTYFQIASNTESIYIPRAINRRAYARSSSQVLTGDSSALLLSPTVTAFNRRQRKLKLDGRRALDDAGPSQLTRHHQ